RPYAADHNGPVLGEGATFLVLEDLETARARDARVMAEIVEAGWGNGPTPPHTGRAARIDDGSPVGRLIRSRPEGVARCYGAGNGDPAVDDWERALLGHDLPARADLVPPQSLAPLFGQHGGVRGPRGGGGPPRAPPGAAASPCSCTASRGAAAAPRSWWARRRERAPLRHARALAGHARALAGHARADRNSTRPN